MDVAAELCGGEVLGKGACGGVGGGRGAVCGARDDASFEGYGRGISLL